MVQGLNPGGDEIFRNCPDRPWCPLSFLYNGYRVFPGGKERPGRDTDPSPPSSAIGHKRVQLYLYSPFEPYGLYREPQCLYKGALYLTWSVVFGSLKGEKYSERCERKREERDEE
jgi:hypothetical protein